MGYAVASAAWRRGAHVVLVSGPTALANPVGVELVQVQTALEMRDRVADALPRADVTVFAAAVADYRPAQEREEKVKRAKAGAEWRLGLVTNPDVAAETRALRREGAVTVGFALETSELLDNARAKLALKGFDLLVANDATAQGSGFEVDTNQVSLLWKEGREETLPLLSKDEVAEEILDRVADLLARGSGARG
jgi:phosphopantothenoylcysteine decarboxylase/phosphopantothenate--cysteine ligase